MTSNPNLISNAKHVKVDARFTETGAYYPALIYTFKGQEITVTHGRKFPIGSKHVVKDIAYYDAIGYNGYGGQSVIYFVTTNGDRIASHNCAWNFNHANVMHEYEREQYLGTM